MNANKARRYGRIKKLVNFEIIIFTKFKFLKVSLRRKIQMFKCFVSFGTVNVKNERGYRNKEIL